MALPDENLDSLLWKLEITPQLGSKSYTTGTKLVILHILLTRLHEIKSSFRSSLPLVGGFVRDLIKSWPRFMNVATLCVENLSELG